MGECGSFSAYGVKLHLLRSTNRVPFSQELTAANVAEVRLAEELLAEANLGIGVAALHVEHPLDQKRWVVGPVNHTVTQPDRDILGASTRLIVIPSSRLPKPGRG